MEKVTIDQALEELQTIIIKYPEKNMLKVYNDLEEGRPPSISPLYIGRQFDIDTELNTLKPIGKNRISINKLAQDIKTIVNPLKLYNPYLPALGWRYGPATLATAFGIELDLDNVKFPSAPKRNLPLKAFENFDPPDINIAGCFPEIKETIEFYKANTPPWIKILLPDMQGPFNIAHTIVGTELYYALTDAPRLVHRFMQLVTDFLIHCYKILPQWIGKKRMINYIGKSKCIAECSCNLISKDMYREFVKPYDLQLQRVLGNIGIHPCSGPQVFEVTLDELPNVFYTECGIIEHAFAGSVDIDRALQRIGDRPIILAVGEELVEEREEEIITGHLRKIHQHSLMTFSYTGMYWKKRDEPLIIELHKRMDDVYLKKDKL